MTSNPLFIIVAESMVFLVPMRQVGWASASATVGALHLFARSRQNGPPEAVSTIPATARASSPTRHWKIALCSLSTGSSCAPPRFAAVDQQLARGDDQLFVGDGDVDAALDGREDRVEGNGAVGRGQHDVGLALDGDAHQTFGTVGRRRRKRVSKRRDLLGEQIRVATGREADDFETIGVPRDDVERLRSDRSRRTENRYSLAHGAFIDCTCRIPSRCSVAKNAMPPKR